MTVRTFGRKGCEGGDTAGRREAIAPEERARGFGLAQPVGDDDEMARRREAFIAEERARKVRLAENPQAGGSDPAARQPTYVREKSMGVAFALWFGLGAVGAHRFYLGFPVSGTIQASLWIVSWMMILGGFPYAMFGAMIGGFWILTDCVVIPRLCRLANARAQQHAVAYAFT